MAAEILAKAFAHAVNTSLAHHGEECLARISRAQEFSRWNIATIDGPSGEREDAAFPRLIQPMRLETLRFSSAHQVFLTTDFVG